MNMPPDNQDSVYLSMEAYKQHHKKRKFSSSTPHKRSDSDDIVCMGAHLGPFAQGPKQKSWPSRPAKLEIHVDDVEPQNSAGDLAVAPTTNATRLAPVIGRSRGGSRSMTTLAHPPDDLYWSKEDFAQYVAQRDRDQGRGTRRGSPSEMSMDTPYSVAPSMIEDCSVQDGHTPTPQRVTRAFTDVPDPRTPSPPPSVVMTTDDDTYYNPPSIVGTSPFSSLKRKRGHENLVGLNAE